MLFTLKLDLRWGQCFVTWHDTGYSGLSVYFPGYEREFLLKRLCSHGATSFKSPQSGQWHAENHENSRNSKEFTRNPCVVWRCCIDHKLENIFPPPEWRPRREGKKTWSFLEVCHLGFLLGESFPNWISLENFKFHSRLWCSGSAAIPNWWIIGL